MTPPRISFEFFPPKSLDASFRLWETIRTLAPLRPEFVSVTYGAGGTTRDLTHDAVTTINKRTGLRVAAHLTCVEATRDETLAIADSYADAGITDIVALRGDPPDGRRFAPHPGGFADTGELIAALAATGRFTIRVGAYPDRHPDAATDTSDVDWLRRKLDAGASSAITQFFFDADTFFRFRDRCAAAGIDRPIVPGILPIESWKGVRRFAERCGTPVPAWLDDAFATAGQNGGSDALATRLCTDLCTRLVEGGVEDLHFYTLNKPHLTRDVARALGVVPQGGLERVA
ncbi:MetF [Oceaniovalibus guishaninsula JLT2003]|uniref:Methylenetetrahydrofolate reductase n=1 Tax=Oceaniovalibus guishaninsula JLT2003 TaxID=1231392 RepID=K2HBN0_9RHOB|nr:methylenetetrahydrofolate reductase [NAD(P)H] [Oceaniovalibus guishaninsula]EKE44022.1 MetF [Oceaniovalibus guishaninsula JLT2003]